MDKKNKPQRTFAERLGYRWMMRCLKAIEAHGKAAAAARKNGDPPLRREARVFVKRVSARAFRKSHREFVKLYKRAATEAVALINTDASLHATALFRAPVDKETREDQKKHFHPLSHLLEIHISW